MRLIDADAVLAEITDFLDEYSEVDGNGLHNPKWCAMEEAKDVILNAPTVFTIRTGYWKEETDRKNHWRCSNCQRVEGITSITMHYCPFCGAKMERHPYVVSRYGQA